MTLRDAYDLGLDALDLQLCLDMEWSRPAYPSLLEQREVPPVQGDLPSNEGTDSGDPKPSSS